MKYLILALIAAASVAVGGCASVDRARVEAEATYSAKADDLQFTVALVSYSKE